MLRISEIYPCLQGEGLQAGRPSVLLRLFGCNLRCTWCDSKHTYETAEDSHPQFIRETEEKVAANLIRLAHPHISNLMITGGEPTLQPFHRLLPYLPEHWNIEVETNGTLLPHQMFQDFLPEFYQRFQWNISPKGINAHQNLNWESLKFWSELQQQGHKVIFKYVVSKSEFQACKNELLELEARLNWNKNSVILMPEGMTLESQQDIQDLYQLCLETGYRLSLRLHVILFGNKRGV